MRRKGIEPIVSVILLLLITIALAGGVLVWLTGYVGGFQQDILVKGTACIRTNASYVTFRGYLQNTLDSPLPANKVSATILTGPSTVVLFANGANGTSVQIPSTQVAAGTQTVFSIPAQTVNGTGEVLSGTYSIEFASKAIDKETFQCP